LKEYGKKKKSLQKFCKLAKKFRAKEARVISTKNVFTALWVRQKCQFGCNEYGKTLTCPPFSPCPENTRKILDSYNKAILVHSTDEWGDVKEIIVKLEREIFISGYYKAWALGAGPCNFCNKCNLKHCIHPKKARPSKEIKYDDNQKQ